MARIKVRARALDMLGRQQMASIPNALHELFKNAYDAYANNVRVDYFRRSKLLVLHDDGVGMTEEEFETRWLTLGTESKVKSVGLEPYKDPNQEPTSSSWRERDRAARHCYHRPHKSLLQRVQNVKMV